MRNEVFVAAVVLVSFMALPAFTHNQQTQWSYHEQVDQMDDSVWRYVRAPSDEEGDTWRALIECEKPNRLSLHRSYPINTGFETGTLRVRLDKRSPTEHEALRYNDRAIHFDDPDLLDTLELDMLLRIEIPAKVTGTKYIVTFGLLSFNKAWSNCPDPE